MMTSETEKGQDFSRIILLSSCYNDWENVQLLIESIDLALSKITQKGIWVIVDDGSTQKIAEPDLSKCNCLQEIRIVRLATNIGHQKALAVGLCHVAENLSGSGVLIIDADGEDKPSDIPALVFEGLNNPANTGIVFAERRIRSEGWLFGLFYTIYRILHNVLTGKKIRFGNYSFIPWSWLGVVVAEVDIWNHYAAAVNKSKIPITTIPTYREKRVEGKSHMQFADLVLHGLSAIFCYAEIIGVRLIIFLSFVLIGVFFIGLLLFMCDFIGVDIVILNHFSTGLIITIWLFALQTFLITLGFIGIVLHNRKSHIKIPLKFYKQFIINEYAIKNNIE